MNLKQAIANNATISRVVAKTWKAAPTIAFCTGAVGSVASLYLMWRAAKKHDETMADIQDILDDVHEKKPVELEEENNEANDEALSVTQYRTELVKAYIQAGFKLGKLYAPVAVAEVASIGLMSFGYGKLNSRYVSTLAACTLMERQYAKYRQNVIDILGEDADQEFRFGLKNKEFEREDLDKNGKSKLDKNGNPKTKKVIERVIDEELDQYSMYARIYDSAHANQCEKGEDATSYYNREFLIQAQDYFNMMLKYRPNHTVFLNEVYSYLGYEPTKAGQAVGWHYDPDYPTGDNKIMFVPIEFYDEKYQAESVIIDFNVDGVVLDLL